MTKRPALTDQSFLAYLFSPKKNALPTGLRARPIAQTKGRKVARVNAYNKFPAFKQEALRRSGLRDAFLKGEVTYTDAKKALRTSAVAKGVVKPVRQRSTPIKGKRKNTPKDIAEHFIYQLRRAKKWYDPATVVAGSHFVKEDDALDLAYDQIKMRAKDTNFMMDDGTGHEFNPYWYR